MRFLMCRPIYFDVTYAINPWMQQHMHRIDAAEARQQWHSLYNSIIDHAEIVLIRPQREHPDMTYTVGAGFAYDSTVILGHFRHEERRSEERWFAEWFHDAGFSIHTMPAALTFEGAGDTVIEPLADRIWFGHGQRSHHGAQHWLEQWTQHSVLGLKLIDPRFFHLDTCFNFLPGGELLYYPQAFDETSQELIAELIPTQQQIIVSEADAINFACNALTLGERMLTHTMSNDLRKVLQRRGYQVIELNLGEFLKGGGSARSMALKLDETIVPQIQPIQP